MARALDSRWILGIAVLSVLAAVLWSLHRRNLASSVEPTAAVEVPSMPEVELLGVPPGSEVTLDGAKIETLRFGVSAGSRHAVEVRGPDGGLWRQVFRANGPIGLLVELQAPVEPEEAGPGQGSVDAEATAETPEPDPPDSPEAQPAR